MFTKPNRPLPFPPPLAKSPFRSPFPNLPRCPFPSPSSFCAAIAESEENCQNLPPPLAPRSFRRHSQFLSAAAAASLARRRGLQGSLNLLRPSASARPTVPPSSTARRYLGVLRRSVGGMVQYWTRTTVFPFSGHIRKPILGSGEGRSKARAGDSPFRAGGRASKV